MMLPRPLEASADARVNDIQERVGLRQPLIIEPGREQETSLVSGLTPE